MQFHIIDAEANVIQEAGAKGVGPVDNFIVYRRVREAGAQQRERIRKGVMLLSVRVPPENVVAAAGIKIDFYIVLVIVESLSPSVDEIFLGTATRRGWIQWRTEQRLRYRIDGFRDYVVREWRIAVERIV